MELGSKNGISVFFPAYNDGGTIASMVLSAVLVLERLTDDYEVIVVNDGSHDYTREILDELERRYDKVRIVHHEKNKGYGGALRTGFSEASKEFVFYTDGDAQYDVRDLPALWKQMDGKNVISFSWKGSIYFHCSEPETVELPIFPCQLELIPAPFFCFI